MTQILGWNIESVERVCAVDNASRLAHVDEFDREYVRRIRDFLTREVDGKGIALLVPPSSDFVRGLQIGGSDSIQDDEDLPGSVVINQSAYGRRTVMDDGLQ